MSLIALATLIWINPTEYENGAPLNLYGTRIEWGDCDPFVEQGRVVLLGAVTSAAVPSGDARCFRLFSLSADAESEPTLARFGEPMPPTNLVAQ